MQTYFEKDFVTIGYDQGDHIIIVKWKLTPTSAEFREGLNTLTTIIEHFKTGKVIGDTTHMGAIHPDDQQWSATEWFQSALKSGLSQLAFIVPSDIFTQMSLDGAKSQVVGEHPIAYFENMESAIDWLKKSSNSNISSSPSNQ
ncbi:MAG TPA: hypothetical protein VL443_22365 [Cyclobacteriaceae bacterium]|jgi:hypothetical protein|nr:hypothetical protein [Cyclobacteriaceae bacterium]